MKLKLTCLKCKVSVEVEPEIIEIGEHKFVQRPEYYCAKCNAHCMYYLIQDEDS